MSDVLATGNLLICYALKAKKQKSEQLVEALASGALAEQVSPLRARGDGSTPVPLPPPNLPQGAIHYCNAASRSMNRSLRICFSRIA
jgi:hypothetical protein